MCGLVGMMGAITSKEEKLFKDLLMIDAVRGEHSTGAAVIGDDDSVQVTKKAGGPSNLLNDWFFQRSLDGLNKVLIGHNRYATRGAKTEANAHPFHVGHIVGAHNGTLTTDCMKAMGKKDYPVDSLACFANIAEEGWENTLPKLRGAWALTWWDTKEKVLRMTCNGERPFYFCYSEDKKKIFWASEKEMLRFAMHRLGLKIDKGMYYTLHEDKVYTFTPPKDRTMTIDKPKGEPYALTKKDPVKHHYHGGGINYWDSFGARNRPPEKGQKSQKRQPSGYTMLDLFEPVEVKLTKNQLLNTTQVEYVYGSKTLTANSMKEKLAEECSNCGTVPELSDMKNSPAWIHPNGEYVCDSCMDFLIAGETQQTKTLFHPRLN